MMDILATDQVERDSAANVVPPTFPFLMEKASGVIHPYHETLANRGDLVVGCYNLDGSFDEKDRDPMYDPRSYDLGGEQDKERLERLERAEMLRRRARIAQDVVTEDDLRVIREEVLAEERERIRAEIRAELSKESAQFSPLSGFEAGAVPSPYPAEVNASAPQPEPVPAALSATAPEVVIPAGPVTEGDLERAFAEITD